MRRFSVELGPPRLLETAVVLPAADAAPVEELRSALRDAELAVCGGARADDGGGLPHVSLAYARLEAPAAATLAALARHADVVVPVAVSRLTLLRLRRDYRWEPLERVPLGA